jgi:hypothetical protein
MTHSSDAPGNWLFDRLAAERTQAVAALGLTERQARFLVEVMIHSGVFVERQYCRFAGIVHGQKTHDFLRKLVERGYARPIQVGSLHRGRLFHVSHKPLYAAIGQGDNRHRKSMPIGRMVERLMVLDAVLADRSFTWLGTEQDKRTHFLTHLQERVRDDDFPRITFGSGEASTRRCFPDKLPIGIRPDSDDHVFIYLTTRPMPDDFRVFLQRHAALLGLLKRWAIQVLVPAPMANAIPRFGQAARDELATPLRLNMAQELEWYFHERQRHEQALDVADEDRFRRARAAFSAPRYRVLYRAWQKHGDSVVWATTSHVLRDALERKEGRVEFVQLSHQYMHLSSLVGVA